MKNLFEFGFENYCVTYDGKVYSNKSGRFLAQQDLKGYRRVTLWANGKKCSMLVHRLVAMAYLSNPEGKLTVNHKDGNKSNNIASNLEWATHSENMQHAIITELLPIRTLSEDVVHSICKYMEEGFRPKDIEGFTGVNTSIIAKIKSRQIYTEISDEYDFSNLLARRSKISVDKIIKVCEMLEQGKNREEIAAELNIGSGTVGRIRRREYHQSISKNYHWS